MLYGEAARFAGLRQETEPGVLPSQVYFNDLKYTVRIARRVRFCHHAVVGVAAKYSFAAKCRIAATLRLSPGRVAASERALLSPGEANSDEVTVEGVIMSRQSKDSTTWHKVCNY